MCRTFNKKGKTMKMFLIAILMALAIVSEGKIMVTEKLLDALAEVESNNNPNKVGKLGELGILQIRECVIQDVNRIYKTNYVLEDAKDDTKSREICKKYLQYWGEKYERKTGLKADNKILSKIWNGGPNGPFKKTTYIIASLDRYWEKVQQHLI